MTGKYLLHASNKRVKFDLVIERQVTILKGDTSTGKSYFAELVREALQVKSGGKSDVNYYTTFKKVVVIADSSQAENLIKANQNALIIMDEDVCLPLYGQLGGLIRYSNNYFLLICRNALVGIPYSMYEIYRFESTQQMLNGKIYTTTSSMFLYKEYLVKSNKLPDILITEGIGTDYAFFNQVLGDVEVIGANGNSNILRTFLKVVDSGKSLSVAILVDSAAFGSQIEHLLYTIQQMPDNIDISILTPESFEWLVLRSKRFRESSSLLNAPYEYCDTRKYYSWEQLFTSELSRRMHEKYGISYNKGSTSMDSKCMKLLISCKKDILEDLGLN